MTDSSGTPRNVRKRLETAIAKHGQAAADINERVLAIEGWFNSLPACTDAVVHGELNDCELWALRLFRSQNRWHIAAAFTDKANDVFPEEGADWQGMNSLSIQHKAAILVHLPKLAVPLIEHYEAKVIPLRDAVDGFDEESKAIGLNLTEGE
ncbi:MAG: hypothetical protein IH985_01675 [Planctomycetes bacterium]|nr:hypothetical protein [Planctomycetota bacterium]